MALVQCPECGKQVSTVASSCPHCGMVLSPPSGVAFVPGTAAAAPEQVLWEGGPSVALVYGRVLRLLVRAIVLYTLGYLLIEYALPALEASSPDLRNVIQTNAGTIDWVTFGILTVLLIPALAGLFQAIAQLKNTHYKVTTQRIVVERGVLSRSLEEIDMRSVDDIEFRQSFMERLFKIGSVWIVSTDKVAPKMILLGIHDPRNTRELIRTTAYQASQRQLFTRSTS